MLINPRVMDSLCKDAGQERTEKAKTYQKEERVKIIKQEIEDSNNFEVSALVVGTKQYHAYVLVRDAEIEDISCDCQDYERHFGVCKHSLAAVLQLAREENETELIELQPKIAIKNVSMDSKYRNFKQIVNNFYNEEIEGIRPEEVALKNQGTIELEPKISYDKFSGELKVEFRIGNKRMYKIKDVTEFYDHMMNQEFYRYGERLQFIHRKEMFTESSRPLLDFLLKYAEIIKYANSNANSNYRYFGKSLSETSILLSHTGIDEIFTIMKGKQVSLKRDYAEGMTEFVEGNPEIEFELIKLSEEEYEIVPNVEIFKVTIIQGKEHKYVLTQDRLYCCTKDFEQANLKLLEMFRQNYMSEVFLRKEDLIQLFSVVMPKMKDAIVVKNILEKELEPYKPKELVVQVYLDFNEQDYLVADVKFTYEEKEFNPLNEEKNLNFSRNMIEETKALNVFHQTGFMLDVKNLRFILPDNDKIYEFLTKDISYYMQRFEVMATDNFKTKQITKPKMGSLGVKVENDLLTIDLGKITVPSDELEEMMEQYKLKRKYYRLKDGSFMKFENNEELDFLDSLVRGMDLKYEDVRAGEVQLPINRTLYLNQLLKGIKSTEIKKNTRYREIVHEFNKESMEGVDVPESLQATLRYYQKVGYQWLQVLDDYRFGGILADDMGLRKNNSSTCYVASGKRK